MSSSKQTPVYTLLSTFALGSWFFLSVSSSAWARSEMTQTDIANASPVEFKRSANPRDNSVGASSFYPYAAEISGQERDRTDQANNEPVVLRKHTSTQDSSSEQVASPQSLARYEQLAMLEQRVATPEKPLEKPVPGVWRNPQTVKTVIRSGDDKRPDEQFTVEVLNRDLTIGGEYEMSAEHRGNFALSDEDNDRDILKHKIELEFKYDVSDRVTAFAETRLKYEDQWREDGDVHEKSIERGETWVDINNAGESAGSSYGIRVGRQNIDEKREWWWEKDLDAIRVYHHSKKLDWELALAKELGRISDREALNADDEDIRRVLGRLKWQYTKDHKLEFFLLDHKDQSFLPAEGDVLSADAEDESDADLTWYGVRALGKGKIKHLGKVEYWVDLGMLGGNEMVIDFDDVDDQTIEVDSVDRQRVKGHGIDLGVTLRPKDWPGAPAITVGFAQGSGDNNPDDGIDRSYRQSGLHNNDGKFEGVNSFRYYGELLRPELSNMRVLTASIGYPLRQHNSIEVLYHRYNQVEASDQLSSRLRLRPDGNNGHIGDEIDVVVGIEHWQNAELELIGSVFRAGDAFGEREGDMSYYLGAEFNYNF